MEICRESEDCNTEKSQPQSQPICTYSKSFWSKLVGPQLFTIHATLIIALRTACYGYFSGILTTLERRFQLSSSEAGTLIIINDISELFFVVITSHFGHKSHRPRWIALGSITMGFGMLICAIPHFSMDPLDPQAVLLGINRGLNYAKDNTTIPNTGLCLYFEEPSHSEEGNANEIFANTTRVPFQPTERTTIFLSSTKPRNGTAEECGQTSSHLGPVAWIVIGQIVVGIGSSPMFPLIMSYIDDGVSKIKYTSYTACIFMAFAIGPPLGLLMGAWASAFYVDFNRIASERIPDLPLDDPRWIGAWWLGLVVCFIGLIVVGIPMYFYPRIMIDAKQNDEEQGKEKGDVMCNGEQQSRRPRERSRGNSIFQRTSQVKGLFRSVKRLIINVPLTMLCIGASAELATIGIFGSFGVKYIQTQFGFSASGASSVFGAILVPVSIFSNMASAYVCRRFQLQVKQCAYFVLLLVFLIVPFIPIAMLVGCPNSDVAGVNSEYSTVSAINDQIRDYDDELDIACNVDCQCSDETFQPVCGANGQTYISPCHAGCTMMNSTVYSGCSCVGGSLISNSTATPGQCATECSASRLVVFIFMTFIILFLMASSQNPGVYILMRIVNDRDRSIAVGWKILVTKCLGYFPAPVYFGAIINSTCTLWQYTCRERGSCWLYDIVSYRYAFFGTLLGLRCFAIFCYVLMIWFLEDDYLDDTKEQTKTGNVTNGDTVKETDFDKPT